MKSAQSRLNNLEADLTPKQVVMMIVAKMMAFNNLDQFIQYACSDESLAETEKMRENMYKAVKNRANSKDAIEVNRFCRKVQREFDFLHDLATAPCLQVEADKFRYLFYVSTLVHLLGKIWWILRDDKTNLKDAIRQFRSIAEQILPELLSDRAAIEEISRQYFNGRPLLFEEQQAWLEALATQVENMIESYNDAVEFLKMPGPDLQIDVAALHALAEEMVSRLVEKAKRGARMKVYDLENRYSDALKMMQQIIQT